MLIESDKTFEHTNIFTLSCNQIGSLLE